MYYFAILTRCSREKPDEGILGGIERRELRSRDGVLRTERELQNRAIFPSSLLILIFHYAKKFPSHNTMKQIMHGSWSSFIKLRFPRYSYYFSSPILSFVRSSLEGPTFCTEIDRRSHFNFERDSRPFLCLWLSHFPALSRALEPEWARNIARISVLIYSSGKLVLPRKRRRREEEALLSLEFVPFAN